MHPLFKSKVLRSGQRHTRRRDTLYGRIVRQIDKQDGTVDSSGLRKGLNKVIRLLKRDTHSRKYNGELLILTANLRLSGNLRSQLGMRQTGTREDRQLLAADQRVQSVNRGYTGLDELLRVYTSRRIHRQAVDIAALLRQDLRTAVDRVSYAVKDTAEHVAGNAQLHTSAQETYFTVGEVDSGVGLVQLNQRISSIDLQNLAAAFLAVGKLDLSQLIIGNILHTFYQHQRTCHFLYGSILFRHLLFPLFDNRCDLCLQFLTDMVIFFLNIFLLRIFITSDSLADIHIEQVTDIGMAV